LEGGALPGSRGAGRGGDGPSGWQRCSPGFIRMPHPAAVITIVRPPSSGVWAVLDYMLSLQLPPRVLPEVVDAAGATAPMDMIVHFAAGRTVADAGRSPRGSDARP